MTEEDRIFFTTDGDESEKQHWAGKHVKKWVERCETCTKGKRIPYATLRPEILNMPQWGLGPEDVVKLVILANLTAPINF